MARKKDETPEEAVAVNSPDASDEQIIAQRSQDVDAETASEHRKVFVLPPGPKPTEENGFSHDANKVAVREYAIQQGLRPDGDVRHISTEPFGPGGLSWALTYGVSVVPAERAEWPDPGMAYVVTDAERDDAGYVHTNTEGAGNTPDSTEDKPTA